MERRIGTELNDLFAIPIPVPIPSMSLPPFSTLQFVRVYSPVCCSCRFRRFSNDPESSVEPLGAIHRAAGIAPPPFLPGKRAEALLVVRHTVMMMAYRLGEVFPPFRVRTGYKEERERESARVVQGIPLRPPSIPPLCTGLFKVSIFFVISFAPSAPSPLPLYGALRFCPWRRGLYVSSLALPPFRSPLRRSFRRRTR